MIQLRFELRGRPRISGLDRIRATYRLDGRRHRFDSDLEVNPKDWDPKRRLVRATAKLTPHRTAINAALREAAGRAEALDSKGIAEERAVTRAEVDHVLAALVPVTSRITSVVTLADYFATYPVRKGYRDNTIAKYRTVAADLLAFRPGLNWKGVTLTLYTDWVGEMKARGLNRASWGKNVAVLKAVMRAGHGEGLHANEAYRKFEAPKDSLKGERREKAWLSEGEVADLLDAPLAGPLEYARDWFAVGLATGQRYSDWAPILAAEESVTASGTRVIDLAQVKSELSEVSIAVTPELAHLRERWREGRMPEVAYNTLRLRLKELAAHLGWDDLVTHTARRTFGRSLWRKGWDISKIQILYGHATLRQTTEYLGLGAAEVRHSVADELAEMMGR